MIDFLLSFLVAFGYLVSYLIGKAKGRKEEQKKKPVPVSPTCPCEHTVGAHVNLGRCLAAVKRPHYNILGSRNGHEYVPCACTKYHGPIPITAEFFNPGTYVSD